MSDFFEKLFKLKKNNTDIRTELIAGFTTFLTMSYVIIVSPSILSTGGIPFSGALTATILVSALSSILMGLVANLPFALAPGMGGHGLLYLPGSHGYGGSMADGPGDRIYLRPHLLSPFHNQGEGNDRPGHTGLHQIWRGSRYRAVYNLDWPERGLFYRLFPGNTGNLW